jgi:hypothetical protein
MTSRWTVRDPDVRGAASADADDAGASPVTKGAARALQPEDRALLIAASPPEAIDTTRQRRRVPREAPRPAVERGYHQTRMREVG